MLRRFSLDFAVFSAFLDLLCIAAALAVSAWLRPLANRLPFAAFIPSPVATPALLYLIFPLVWVAIFLFTSVYDGKRNMRYWRELASVSLGSFLAAVVLAGILYLTYRDVSRLLFVVFSILAYLALVGWRMAYRGAYRAGLLRAVEPRNVLIVGAGVLGREVAHNTLAYHSLGLRLIGFLDDDQEKQSASDVLGPLEEARSVVKNYEVDEVVIALPPRSYDKVFHLVAELHTLPVKVWVIPDYFNLALHKTVLAEFAGIPMLDLRAPALSDTQRLVKRIFDLTFTLLSLPVCLPLMAGIALAIYREDRGPVLFRQPRVGENGHIFHILKFRTMIPGAEDMRSLVEQADEVGRLIHKTADDPRVTRVGKFLRRASLDELPQWLNIIKGEMSLIGPRPELPYLVEKYEPWQRKRFSVPQGLTGWWQVNGRSDKPMHLHTEDDLYYIQNYSVFLDLLILLKTFGAVFRRKGAF